MTPFRPRRPTRGGLAEMLVVLGLAALLSIFRVSAPDRLLEGLERAALDLRFVVRGAAAPGEGAIIVGIDEPTVARFGTLTPLRAALVQVLQRLEHAEPAAIAIDLLLVDPTAADAQLAAAFGASRAVILAVAATAGSATAESLPPELAAAIGRSAVPLVIRPAGLAGASEAPPPPRILFPLPRLIGSAMLGHANIREAPDRLARELPLALRLPDGQYLPALPLAAAWVALGPAPPGLVLELGREVRLGSRVIPTDPQSQVLLNHYGGSGTLPQVSFLDVLEGRVEPGRIRGRAVFIGSTAESLRDEFATPFGPDVAGVEVLATAYLNFLHGDFLERGPRTAAASVALALGFALLGAGAMRLRGTIAPLLAALLVILLALAALQAGFAAARLWLDATGVLGAAILALGVSGYLRYRREKAEADQLERERDNLSYYVAPSLAATLAEGARPDFDGREQMVTVLFVDLEGYTGLVERLPPSVVAEFLRHFHAHVERIASRANAAVVGYMGDGSMIVFGLPDPAPGDAAAALACAAALVAEPFETGTPLIAPRDVRARVSLHTGPVALAILGGERQGHLTVTGDTVNVAARLQEVAKASKVALVASREVLEAAGAEHAAAFRFLASDALRGRQRPIEIWTPEVRPAGA
ncbi:MAG TPA: adenylate/guanylate cyclase domain-containing protein [Paracoccaceae bacterium]|nr:adenylate/guanylate cyclase domain-containing protein [Paracoccaceae bacterium]